MFKIIKVKGDSMSPDFQEGDFVALATVPFFSKRLKAGDVIIFEHKLYGTLIKRIASFDPETAEVYVEGVDAESLDSRRLGTIRRENIRGKVIAHFSKKQRARPLIPLALIIAILAVSTASLFIRFAQREAPSLVIAALRLTFAGLALAPIALSRYRDELRALTRAELLLGLLSGFFLAIHFATWISSLEYTGVASSVVLVSSGPLWVALLAPIFLKEPLTKSVLVGMLLALLGGTVIGLSDSCQIDNGLVCPPLAEFVQGRAFLGNSLALTGAWAVAGYLMIGRRLRGGMSLIPYIFVVYGFAAVVLLGIMSAAGQRPSGFAPMIYIWIILLALVPQLIGHSTYNWALRYLPAALVSITTLGEPIGSAILAYFILSETPAPLTIFGGALILAGIYVSSR